LDILQALNEILLFGKTATATEAVRYGLVSSVVWPDKFLEEIVPRVETLEAMSAAGLTHVKTNMKQVCTYSGI
jgi:enoyl-CoA hydratase/carnithine racemase